MTTTTTSKSTQLPDGWSVSTSYCGSPFLQVETRESAVYTVKFSTAGAEGRVHSVSGKRPRGVIAAERESTDAGYRARMSSARVALAEDLFAGTPPSLTKLRLARGLSQHQLAEATGTSQPHIAKIEAKKVRVLLVTAAKIADALGVSLDDIREMLVYPITAEPPPGQPDLVSVSK